MSIIASAADETLVAVDRLVPGKLGQGPMDDEDGHRRGRAGACAQRRALLGLSSRGEAEFADKLLSAMRFEFGGHLEKSAGKYRRKSRDLTGSKGECSRAAICIPLL